MNDNASVLEANRISAIVEEQNQNGIYGEVGLVNLYLDKTFTLEDGTVLSFDEETLFHASVKYGYAVAHCEVMKKAIAHACKHRNYELEVSVDETSSPTSPQEHLFISLELKRRNVNVVSLAPRFIGEFEKGIDY